MRGVSFIVGKYPDESLLYELISHHEYRQVNRYFYKEGYLFLTITIMLYMILIIVNKILIKEVKHELENENNEKHSEIIGNQDYCHESENECPDSKNDVKHNEEKNIKDNKNKEKQLHDNQAYNIIQEK